MESITAYISGEGWKQMVYADEAQAEIDKYKSALKAVRKSYKEKMHVNIDDIDELLNN